MDAEVKAADRNRNTFYTPWNNHMQTFLAILCVLVTNCLSLAQSCDPRWDTMNGGTNGHINAMARLPNGDIVVGGRFTRAGGVEVNNIARWDGSSWHEMGEGVPVIVQQLRVRANGNLIALGGRTTLAPDVELVDLKEWNGTGWSSLNLTLTSTVSQQHVYSVFVLNDDSVIVFGHFWNINYQPIFNIARLANGVWSQFGRLEEPVNRPSINPSKLVQNADGTLTAYGSHLFPYQTPYPCAYFDGQMWTPINLLTGSTSINDYVSRSNGTEYFGGNRLYVNGQYWGLATRDVGTGMLSALASTNPGAVTTLTPVSTSSIFVGGDFPRLNGFPWNNIALLTDDILSPLGLGTNGGVTASLVLPNGQIVVAGVFTEIDNQPCGRIAKAWPLQDVDITRQPVDQAVAAGSTATFSLQAVQQGSCPTPMALQWQRRDPRVADPNAPDAWIDLVDDGNFVNTTQATFSILNPTAALATGFRCRIQGCSCKNAIYSDEVNFSIACPADFNADGGVDFTDVEAFFERWENGC
jgi:hypothetical protein